MNQKGVGTYSYENVRRRAQELGYALSDADDRLARQNPSAGMTILQYQRIITMRAAMQGARLPISLRKTSGSSTADIRQARTAADMRWTIRRRAIMHGTRRRMRDIGNTVQRHSGRGSAQATMP